MRLSSWYPIFTAAAVLALAPSTAFGHGGGLDRNGCHTNRKTGEYHCHGGSAPKPAPPAVRSATPTTASTVQRVSTNVHAAPTTREKDLVRAAQILLRALGYKPSLLGSLDERTEEAVRGFQRSDNITADGLVTEYLVVRLAQKVAARCE